jgi:hypothetical protein
MSEIQTTIVASESSRVVVYDDGRVKLSVVDASSAEEKERIGYFLPDQMCAVIHESLKLGMHDGSGTVYVRNICSGYFRALGCYYLAMSLLSVQILTENPDARQEMERFTLGMEQLVVHLEKS